MSSRKVAPRIAVYAIASDEEGTVERWSETARDADELVIADTGSTDCTVEIARSCGISVHVINIDPWRFDTARNAALDLISTDVDICLPVDLDEVLSDGWRNEIENAWTQGATRVAYTLQWRWNVIHPPLRYRDAKVHVRHGYRWRSPVHEQLFTSGDDIVFDSTIVIRHLRDSRKPRPSYLDLIRLGAEEDPSDGRMVHMLANELRILGRPDEALPEARRAFEYDLPYHERLHTMLMLSWLEPERRERWLLDACAEFPDEPEPWCELARLRAEQLQWEQSRDAALAARRIDREPTHYLSNPLAWHVLPDEQIAEAEWQIATRRRLAAPTAPSAKRDSSPAAHERSSSRLPTYVVIPVLDQWDHTASFLRQLSDDDDYERVFVFDNGSADKNWQRLLHVEIRATSVFRRRDVGIHHMWNEGWARAAADARGPFNILFANNDISFLPGTLGEMARALRSDPSNWALHPRIGEEVLLEPSIASPTAMTSWLWGCMFMVRGELPIRFDEGYVFHYGETDLKKQIDALGGRTVCASRVQITHVGGASTPDGSWLTDQQVTGDIARFVAKWDS